MRGANKAERKTKFQTRRQKMRDEGIRKTCPVPLTTTTKQEETTMKYNLVQIMRKAWELRKDRGYTMTTALRIAWAEAKGERVYTFRLENARAQISAYLVKLGKAIADVHDQHKYDALRAALLLPVDSVGLAVADGKTVGLCKYACRNA